MILGSTDLIHAKIESYVCECEGVAKEILRSRTRKAEVVLCRQIVIYMMSRYYMGQITLRQMTSYYYQNHATAYHCINKLTNQAEIYPMLRRKLEAYWKDICLLTIELEESKYIELQEV